MESYLITKSKGDCTGCFACASICPKKCITMIKDEEEFSYPKINENLCIHCNLCIKVCPEHVNELFQSNEQAAYGGYIKDEKIRRESTSGGAFSAIAQIFCDKNYVIYGATGNGIDVYHTSIDKVDNLHILRKSKYLQSNINDSYVRAKKDLNNNKKVLFAGTPCQIAALKKYLNRDYVNLLTVEVICEGVPSPLYINKYLAHLNDKFNDKAIAVDYRNKDKRKWDFQIMKISFNQKKPYYLDRWFNPFWNLWLNHLMSRPSCYKCQYAKKERVADITLGDLWGVHIYCKDLYAKNSGSSLIVVNSQKGLKIVEQLKDIMVLRRLDLTTAIKYQSPLRKHIDYNEDRSEFISDLKNLEYKKIIKKWYKKPSISLLFKKYIYGNRQKVSIFNFKNKLFKRKAN